MKNWSKSTLSNKSGKLNDKTHMQITTGNDTLVSDEKLVKKYFIKQIWKVLGQRSLIHKRPLQLPSLIHFLFVGLKCIIFFSSVCILCLYLFLQLLMQFCRLHLPGPVHYMFVLSVYCACLLLSSACLLVFDPILVSFCLLIS